MKHKKQIPSFNVFLFLHALTSPILIPKGINTLLKRFHSLIIKPKFSPDCDHLSSKHVKKHTEKKILESWHIDEPNMSIFGVVVEVEITLAT